MNSQLDPWTAAGTLLNEAVQYVLHDPVLFFYGGTAVITCVLWSVGVALFGKVPAEKQARISKPKRVPATGRLSVSSL